MIDRTHFPRRLVLATALLVGPATAWAGPAFQPLESIRDAARRYLETEASAQGGTVQVEVGRLDPRLRLVNCEQPLSVWLAPGARTHGHTSVGVRCDGAMPWTLFVPAVVRHEYTLVVAARPIARGEILAEDAVSTTTRFLPNAPGGVLTDTGAALGRTAVRDLAAGAVLNAHMLKSPQAVKRGQSVTLSLAEGPVAVRVAGTALRDGALGDRIPVRNLNSKRVVEGVIRDSGLVEVASGRQ